jgi:hypothetical protein
MVEALRGDKPAAMTRTGRDISRLEQEIRRGSGGASKTT